MRSLVFDSNILIYHLKEEEGVRRAISEWAHEGNQLYISAITRTEVLAAPVLREGEEEEIIYLLDQFVLISVDAQIADLAARIRRLCRVTLGDSLIAATALVLNAALVTRNIKDFKKISPLEIIPL